MGAHSHAACAPQSNNYHVWNFGHYLIDARPQHSIVLTQGDLVTNSIRYLQRCHVQADRACAHTQLSLPR